MIGIKVNNEFLYLPADFSFTIEENNPMLVDDSGAFTRIPVRVPRCTHNDDILSFWADIDRASNSNPNRIALYTKKITRNITVASYSSVQMKSITKPISKATGRNLMPQPKRLPE